MSRNNPSPFLFLDIDDVLCLNNRVGGYDVLNAIRGRHAAPEEVYRQIFDRDACQALRQIHEETGNRLRYVISSTWREYFQRDQIRHVFRQSGLEFVASSLHHTWCTSPIGTRADDIGAWLDQHHRREPFAVVDDTFSGKSLAGALTNPRHRFARRVVLCEENVGLLAVHLDPLLTALRTQCSNGRSTHATEVL